jgi:hypothetical protein
MGLKPKDTDTLGNERRKNSKERRRTRRTHVGTSSWLVVVGWGRIIEHKDSNLMCLWLACVLRLRIALDAGKHSQGPHT